MYGWRQQWSERGAIHHGDLVTLRFASLGSLACSLPAAAAAAAAVVALTRAAPSAAARPGEHESEQGSHRGDAWLRRARV